MPPTPAVRQLRLIIEADEFEVDDTDANVAVLADAGVRMMARPVVTPWRSRNARVHGPAGWQVTLFQELEGLDERTRRPGFGTTHRPEDARE